MDDRSGDASALLGMEGFAVLSLGLQGGDHSALRHVETWRTHGSVCRRRSFDGGHGSWSTARPGWQMGIGPDVGRPTDSSLGGPS